MTADRTQGVKQSLSSIDPYQFENFVADLWEHRGWDSEVTSKSQDAGIDVLVEKSEPFNQTQVIQAKRNAPDNKVSSSDIQQYASLQHQVPEADTVIVVTTSEFSAPANNRASVLNVKLVNGDTLLRIIDELDAYDLVEDYTGNTAEGTVQEQETEEDIESVDVVDNSEVQADDEMSTSEAIFAVLQGLVALGIVLFIVFLIIRTLFL
ncbi:restriction endonuclease [Halomicroarcula sp. GCM10025324]|uniref:restriction endonuclease n=1 Tax=Haloarcula TaxID=2237 RepID=UPI0023E7C632|nr:restriction endonuclease [Halomicroarcula sp. ZS-22-S1]